MAKGIRRVFEMIIPQRGTTKRFGRQMKFRIRGKFKSMKEPLQYECKLIDIDSGITVEQKGEKSSESALETAVSEMVKELYLRSILKGNLVEGTSPLPYNNITPSSNILYNIN